MGEVVGLGSWEPVFTVSEVARALRVDTSTVRRWIYAGDLDAFRAGRGHRIRKSALDAFTSGPGASEPQAASA